ncbi:MAG TPA: helix-turn-helix domain-containing protein [Glycomyces sp.]|nr:helix-turn-helix domain-containing protein [Glycomyces sp.]
MQRAVTAPEVSRSDARRNRAKVLKAAQRAFAGEGSSASLGEIARLAGVGAGTVYRHFPTKESLLEAVMAQRVERLTRLAGECGGMDDAGAAFFAFVTEVITSASRNRDLCELLESEDGWPRAVLLTSDRRFVSALASLLAAAQRAGAVRPDLDAAGVQTLITGCVSMQRLHSEPDELAPMAALVVDAMRSGTVTKTAAAPEIRDENAPEAAKRNGRRASPERVCGACGAPIPRTGSGRPARFCGAACRQRAYRSRKRAAAS